MDYLLIKKPTITLKQHFFDQLCLFEEILQRKHNYSLSKDWQSQPSNLEDEVLTNTYLNTLPKGRKSPRASAVDKPSEKGSGISWNRKIKEVIAPKNLHLGDVMKNATIKFDTIGNEETGKQVVEALKDEEASDLGTIKRQFKVILKSKSMKNFDEKTVDGLSFDAISMSANTLGVPKMQLQPRRQSTVALEESEHSRPPSSKAKDQASNDPVVLRRNSSLPQENFHHREWNTTADQQAKIFKTQKIKPPGTFKLRQSPTAGQTTPDSSDPDRGKATGTKTVRSELGRQSE